MADENEALGFCIKGEFVPPCKELTFYEFPDEKDVIVLILEYFKKFLPQVLSRKKDYYNQPISMDPKDIDLVSRKDYGNYVVVLAIADDNSSYSENGLQENTEYAFQIDLQVQEDDTKASLENLIKLKSAVKTLLVNMDNNLNLLTDIEGFSYGYAGDIEDSNKLIRQGTYRFSILGNSYKK